MTRPAPSAPAETTADIALRIYDQAVALGFRHVQLIASRLRHSSTRHVKFSDARGFNWHVRVSHRPVPAHLTPPDFDAVCLQGARGQALITAFFHAVLTAAILPIGRDRRPRRRRR